MSDQLEINNLIYKYARLVDEGDFESIGKLFSGGRIVFSDGINDTEVSGAADITSMYENTTRRYRDGTPKTHHATSNIELRINGKSAYGTSYYTVFQQLPDFPLQPIIAGVYFDEFYRNEDEWFFKIRSIKVSLLGDTSRHLLITL
jgi:ketosteroid isomerase-like protein